MNIKKGDKFKDYIGTPCFISYIKGDIVKLSFIEERPHVEVWDKNEFLEQIKLNRFFPPSMDYDHQATRDVQVLRYSSYKEDI